MTRLSSLVLLSAAAIALAAPAFAKMSVQSAEGLCKSEINKQQPEAKSVKVDKQSTKATGASFIYTFKVKASDDSLAKMICTVDRSTDSVASITKTAD
ncbi:MAG: hypothetical protein Q8R82_06565 [Hyphomonadaceae bacterium]|nr:hypothetical protein [Hyphomonadaceae bacterium]